VFASTVVLTFIGLSDGQNLCGTVCPLLYSPWCCTAGSQYLTFINACEARRYECRNPGTRKLQKNILHILQQFCYYTKGFVINGNWGSIYGKCIRYFINMYVILNVIYYKKFFTYSLENNLKRLSTKITKGVNEKISARLS
jgi:hypothetical protein